MGGVVNIGLYLSDKDKLKSEFFSYINKAIYLLFDSKPQFESGYLWFAETDEEVKSADYQFLVNQLYSRIDVYNTFKFFIYDSLEITVQTSFINNDVGCDILIRYADIIKFFESEEKFLNFIKGGLKSLYLDIPYKYLFVDNDIEVEATYDEMLSWCPDYAFPLLAIERKDTNGIAIYQANFDLQGLQVMNKL